MLRALRVYRYLFWIVISLWANSALAITTVAPPIPADQLKESNVGAYLGIRTDLLPKELEAQLPEDVLIGEGIMVTGFMPDSPAPKQGVKQYDIILKFNNIPIKHPKQFIQLIKHNKPGNKVKLTIVRKGKIMTLPLVMGSQKYPLDEDQLDYQFDMQTLGYRGYSVKMPRKNYFEATIRYLAPDGVVRRRTFKGFYNQVMAEIQAAPDMSLPAKQKLMSVIKEKKDDEDGWFGDMMPFSDGVFNF